MRTRDGPRERGQLVIVMGLVLAIIFIALALILNSAIYAENVSTRETADSSEVATAFETAAGDVESLMQRANRHHNDSHDAVNEAFDEMMANWTDDVSRQRAMGGTAFDVEVVDRENGSHIRQTDATREFTADGSDTDWTLVTDVIHISDYRLVVSNEDPLYQDSPSNYAAIRDNAFHANFTDGKNSTLVYIYRNTSDHVVVFAGNESHLDSVSTVENVDGFSDDCRTSTDNATIELATGTVDGQTCDAIDIGPDLLGALTIKYHKGDAAKGTYEFYVHETASPQTGNLSSTPGNSPYYVPALYGTAIDVTYTRSDIDHERRMLVVAGDEVYSSGALLP